MAAGRESESVGTLTTTESSESAQKPGARIIETLRVQVVSDIDRVIAFHYQQKAGVIPINSRRFGGGLK